MSSSTGGFNHQIEYNYASLFKYLYLNYTVKFVKYYLTFVVLISSEDLVKNISITYNLYTSFYFSFLNFIILSWAGMLWPIIG